MLNKVYNWTDEMNRSEMQGRFLQMLICSPPFLKGKRMINGIPTILCYKKGNIEYAPDDSFVGADLNALDSFFKRCVIHSKDF